MGRYCDDGPLTSSAQRRLVTGRRVRLVLPQLAYRVVGNWVGTVDMSQGSLFPGRVAIGTLYAAAAFLKDKPVSIAFNAFAKSLGQSGRSLFCLYEPHSTDIVFGRRHRRTSLTQFANGRQKRHGRLTLSNNRRQQWVRRRQMARLGEARRTSDSTAMGVLRRKSCQENGRRPKERRHPGQKMLIHPIAFEHKILNSIYLSY
ncbi:hypothetical protein EVAR_81010_1 [Eumeta japonica]|uniref:Uncharacterized protein n=1 Tax=Eumeta variegata TaxID=151549 RepID=A0A4C1T836_EUMVA|nr:hypothetical protein EVAR_81010_1 [Eumeta japonica]